MADPATYRPKTSEIPTAPGVYRFRDEHGTVVYVGKAKNLRARLTSYFQDPAGLHPRTFAMVTTAASVDWVTVKSEVEALQLEWQWIKEYDPRFNVRFRDDKSYPWLAITMHEEFPRAMVMRGERRKGIRYFGPYTQAWAIRESLDLLLRVFPVRTCNATVFRRAQLQQRPCLLGYIDRCSAPCVGRIEADEHRAIADGLVAFLDGDTKQVLRGLQDEMRASAAHENFERAARLRDDLAALESVIEKSTVVLDEGTDADLIGIGADELQAGVALFHVRRGRIVGQRSFTLERPLETTLEDLVLQVCERVYGGESGEYVPRLLLVQALPDEHAALAQWLGERRGSAVEVRVPVRGDKRVLLETVVENATATLNRSKQSRATDLTTRSRALEELREALEFPTALLRIECIDVSHLAGEDVVASLVVFEDGLPKKRDYRRFVVRHGRGNDDVASIAEVVRRRFTMDSDKPSTFAYEPGLLVVDGGKPQVTAAVHALHEVGRTDVQVVGIAKRLEEVWTPTLEDPVILPRSSEALFLLQRVRDEAHRFAIAHQRQRRAKRSVHSLLDDVPGLGERKREALLRTFKTVKGIRAASDEELLAIPGFGPKLVDAIRSALQPDAQGLAPFNASTGELLQED